MSGCSHVVQHETQYLESRMCQSTSVIKYGFDDDDRDYYACELHKEQAIAIADQVISISY